MDDDTNDNNNNTNTNNVNIIGMNDNNIEYKGQFGGDDNEEELQFYEYGAHFKYKDLYNKLQHLSSTTFINENEVVSSPHRNNSHKESKYNNKYFSTSTFQSRNINNNHYHSIKQGNIDMCNKGTEKDGMFVIANEKGSHIKGNNTFGTKTHNNNINKRTHGLSGNKNKSKVTTGNKNSTVKKKDKGDIKHNNKNKIQSSIANNINNNNNNVNSHSNSKQKNNNNNNIKSISNKKPFISAISNNTNVLLYPKHQQKLSSSYQNLCMNKIISPSKKPITRGLISNIKYKKVSTNPSLNKKQISPQTNHNNNIQTDYKQNTANLKSRNCYNDILNQHTRGIKDNNNNMLHYNNKKPKKEEEKQSLTYQQSNNNEPIKPIVNNGLISKNKNTTSNQTTTHSKAHNEIIGIIIKQKPHSQDRPNNNTFQSNVIKNVTKHIMKKNTKQNVSKPQSANIACTVINSIKKGNSLTNRKISPSSGKQPISNKQKLQKHYQIKQKHFLKKNVINNITTIHIPIQERLPSSGSKNNAKISSRHSRNTNITKTPININTCINNNNSNNNNLIIKNTRPVSNSSHNKHKLFSGKYGMIKHNNDKGNINIKVKQIINNNNSNKKGVLQCVSKTEENGTAKLLHKENSNKKEKNIMINTLLTEPKVNIYNELNSSPIDIKED